MTKRCERIFFPLSANPPKRNVSPEAIRKYEILISEYRQNAKQQKTPEVFQTILPENGTLNPGDLVYFREMNGEVVEVIPVRISRAVDDEVLAEKLREDRRPCVREILKPSKEEAVKKEGIKSLFQHHPKGLCPACSLFGTSFYKGRVSFGFAQGGKEGNAPSLMNNGEFITLPLQERPRPTWSIPKNVEGADSQDRFTVPGRKFYVHHNNWEKVLKESQEGNIPRTDNNRSVQAVAPGSEFTFEVRFENLGEDELGLLIYALGLEAGISHKMGMAKAFGFGSVDIRVEKVVTEKELDWDALKPQTIEKLKKLWNASSEDGLRTKLRNLFQLLFVPETSPKVRYPSLRKEDDPEKLPGYVELGDQEEKFAPQDRQKKLKTPWSPWHTEKSQG
jgi:CRISPR-associated protein (TIGR03986 family)